MDEQALNLNSSFYDEQSHRVRRSSSRRTSIFDVFSLRRKRGNVPAEKENEEGQPVGESLRSIEEDESSVHGECSSVKVTNQSPARKAKRVLGIESPVKRVRNSLAEEKRLRGVDKQAQRAAFVTPARATVGAARSEHPIAPLASPGTSPDEFLISPEKRMKHAGRDKEDRMETSTCPPTPKKSSAFQYSKLSSSCLHLVKASPLGSLGRSISSIRSPSLLSLRSRVPSASSLRTPCSKPKKQHHASSDALEMGPNSSFCTPSMSSGTPLRSSSRLSLTRMANAVMKGIATAPRNTKAKSRLKMTPSVEKKFAPTRNAASSSRHPGYHVVQDIDGITRQREKLQKFAKKVRFLKNEVVELASAEAPLYDAIVCDVSPTGEPLSATSKLILDRIGEEGIDHLNFELQWHRRIVLTESGQFSASKYVMFVADSGMPGDVEKTWQDVRSAFVGIFNKAMEHSGIQTMLLPFLFTKAPGRDPEMLTRTTIDSIHYMFLVSDFEGLERVDVGGVGNANGWSAKFGNYWESLLRKMRRDAEVDAESVTADADVLPQAIAAGAESRKTDDDGRTVSGIGDLNELPETTV